jgi:hypothetical protein
MAASLSSRFGLPAMLLLEGSHDREQLPPLFVTVK